MPFPDEVRPVRVVPYRAEWPAEFDHLATRLTPALAELGASIEHIGSTSVPGLAAKDVIDAQVLVEELDRDRVIAAFAALGFRWRPEEWNNLDKVVFAPPVGDRPVNVHVRTRGDEQSRAAALFRDYLTANADARGAWGDFKVRVAEEVTDLGAYGQIKQPAWRVLMFAAEQWRLTQTMSS